MTSTSTLDIAPGAALDIKSLRNRLHGDLLTPGDADYEEARKVVNLAYNRHPWVIVRAASSADVVQAVRFARLHQLPIAVRGGGHSLSGLAVMDGSLVIDLSRMKRVNIDPEQRTARVQAGATSGDLAGPAHAYGLALSTGDTESVGLGGLTTGGGIGYMVRKYGLAIDNLLAVEIVTAAGRLVRASAAQHSDLFWAVRGGGGNFGIVTEFTFRMAPVGAVVGGALVLPATPEVVRGFLDYTLNAPDELSAICDLTLAPPAPFIPEDKVGTPVLFITAVFAGSEDDAEAAYAPLRALAEPIADLIGPMPYPGIYEFTKEAAQPLGAAVRSFFSNGFSDEDYQAMIEALVNSVSPVAIVQLRALGGAFARVAPGETAFAHRDKNFFFAAIGIWFDGSEDATPHREWAAGIYEQLKHRADGVYVNFLGEDGDERIRSAYPGATYERLVEVKRAYDPNNIFQFNQNIRPGAR